MCVYMNDVRKLGCCKRKELLYVYIYVSYIHTYIRAFVYTGMYLHERACICINALLHECGSHAADRCHNHCRHIKLYAHRHRQTQTWTQTHRHRHRHTDIDTDTDIEIDTDTETQTQTQTQTQTHTLTNKTHD